MKIERKLKLAKILRNTGRAFAIGFLITGIVAIATHRSYFGCIWGLIVSIAMMVNGSLEIEKYTLGKDNETQKTH